MKQLFGGSDSKEQSNNKAYGYLKDQFGGQIQAGNQATNALSGLLGIGGDPAAQDAAFKKFINSSGYQFQLGQGLDSLNANAATNGLLNSGALVNHTQQFGNDLATQGFQNYLTQLNGMTTLGQNAGQIISGAGQSSSGRTSTTGGIIPGIASLFPGG